MKKALVLLSLFALSIVPGGLLALTHEQTEGREEINHGWIFRHNEQLTPEIAPFVKKIRVGKHANLIKSFKRPLIPLKRLKLSVAAQNAIPLEKTLKNKVKVPLVALYQSQAEGMSFLTADYANDLSDLDSSSDIYVKIGLIYKPLFHGNGYRACARVIQAGKKSPTLFEVGIFGGGERCDKTIYRLLEDTAKTVHEDLYDHPETIDPMTYIKKVLSVSTWLEGYVVYKDMDQDGMMEIVNNTKAAHPGELKAKLKEKYSLDDNDFQGGFRQIDSVYKWDEKKEEFKNIGEYYFSR
jgi:hypothetical protein